MNRIAYQQLLNDYAQFHKRQTTMDFHHQLKGAILDAVDEGLIERGDSQGNHQGEATGCSPKSSISINLSYTRC